MSLSKPPDQFGLPFGGHLAVARISLSGMVTVPIRPLSAAIANRSLAVSSSIDTLRFAG